VPGYVLLQPLLSVGVRPNLHQSRLINPIENFVRIGHVEKIHFQVRVNRGVLPNMEGVTCIWQHQFFQYDRANEGVESKIHDSSKPRKNAWHQKTEIDDLHTVSPGRCGEADHLALEPDQLGLLAFWDQLRTVGWHVACDKGWGSGLIWIFSITEFTVKSSIINLIIAHLSQPKLFRLLVKKSLRNLSFPSWKIKSLLTMISQIWDLVSSQ